MRRLVMILGGVGLVGICHAQSMGLKELTTLLDLSANKKIEAALQRKGFRNTYSQDENYLQSFEWEGKGKNKEREPSGRFVHLGKENSVIYQIKSSEENSELLKEIQGAGFRSCAGKDSFSIFFQHLDTRIECWRKQEDSTQFFLMRFSRKSLPKRKEIMYAEDLLKLDAEEYLVEVFGKQSLKSSYFYYTEKDSNRCTVLFPNTQMEAIFVWEDEANSKDLAFILIGGSLRGERASRLNKPVANNAWISKQGVYCGMSLREVRALNQDALTFYNWSHESAGHLVAVNKGRLDFKSLGLVFNCLNCDFVETKKGDFTDSDTALGENQKVFISEIIILPEKNK